MTEIVGEQQQQHKTKTKEEEEEEKEEQEWMNNQVKHFIAGFCARASAASIMFPIDTIKTRLQFSAAVLAHQNEANFKTSVTRT